MPYTRPIADRLELSLVEIFNPGAAQTLLAAFDAGQSVVMRATTVADPGDDWTAFLVDGVEVVRIPGY